jgi:hypothetical protein
VAIPDKESPSNRGDQRTAGRSAAADDGAGGGEEELVWQRPSPRAVPSVRLATEGPTVHGAQEAQGVDIAGPHLARANENARKAVTALSISRIPPLPWVLTPRIDLSTRTNFVSRYRCWERLFIDLSRTDVGNGIRPHTFDGITNDECSCWLAHEHSQIEHPLFGMSDRWAGRIALRRSWLQFEAVELRSGRSRRTRR